MKLRIVKDDNYNLCEIDYNYYLFCSENINVKFKFSMYKNINRYKSLQIFIESNNIDITADLYFCIMKYILPE